MATLATPAEKKGQQVPEEKSERNRPARPRVDEKFKIFSGTANEAYANGTDGAAASGGASMHLTTPDLNFAIPGALLYFMVGGCGANVTYVYEFYG
jgi:hypothetical protein